MMTLKHVYRFELEVPFTGLSGKRGWIFDAALTDGRMVALEYQGIGPGHQWPKQQAKDHEKASEAALCGGTLIFCDAISVNNGRCLEFVETALQQEVTAHE